MKTIPDFVNALKARFQPSDIGLYFIPMFRPMFRKQDRLHMSVVTLPTANRVNTLPKPFHPL